MLFQNVPHNLRLHLRSLSQYKMHLLHMHTNAIALDGREMPLLPVISETIKYIADKAIEKLTD